MTCATAMRLVQPARRGSDQPPPHEAGPRSTPERRLHERIHDDEAIGRELREAWRAIRGRRERGA